MGFKLYTSNRIEELAAIFCDKIKHKDKWNQVSNIIVQTKGLEKWLAKQAAAKNKIFANYEFSNPDGFMGKIQQLAGIYSNNYFSAQNIKWKAFVYLSDSEFAKSFPVVADYYLNDDIKRIQLAGKVADLLEQYQIYRPHIIEAWNNDTKLESIKDEDFIKQEAWQRWIWQKLKTESNGRYDGLQRKQKLLEKMDAEEFKASVKEQFPRIHLFGIAVLSNYHLDIYQKLASIIDISVYITSPSSTDNWYSQKALKRENELLSSCKDLSANLHRLFAMDEGQKTYFEPKGTNLLSTLQRDIYYNHSEGIKNYDTKQADNSLRIVSSYTPVREVEALYNHLLNEFEKNPDLKGSNVSVQLANVDLYAPLVKAVFDNAPKKIPYFIADQAFSVGDSLINAVDVFFNLPHTNFKAENVLQLLDFRAIRQQFDIQDVELIRQMVADANIRYGIEGNVADETYLFSWKHGLSKLILGYAIKGGDSYELNDREYFPTDAIEGSEALNIFKIKAFADVLFHLHHNAQNDRTIAEWKDFLLDEVFARLFSVDDIYNDELDYVYKKLENLSRMTIEVEERISFQVFREGLMNLLNAETTNSIYTSGLLTFSSIIPVRSLPYKHIAILGLNAGEFPRQQKELGFDLMGICLAENDRNVKNNDKYLFLEALLSARNQVYLSYIGSSIKDNSELPPSLLIEELEDYIVTGTRNKEWFGAQIKYKHPLHASSKLYFDEGKFFTYLGQSTKEELPDLKDNEIREDVSLNFDEIQLNDLVRFFKDPFKWYYNKTLRIYYSDDAILLPDEEPFELDHLQKWSLKNELVNLSPEEEEAYIKRKKNDGLIQLANMAKAELSIEEKEIETVKEAYANYRTGEAKTEAINLKIGDTILRGKIDNIYNEKQVQYNVSGPNSQAKYLLDLYIRHLAYKASNANAQSVFVSATYNFPLDSNFIDEEEAKHTLKLLINIYKKGHTELIPFAPKAALLLMNLLYHDAKDYDIDTAINKAFADMTGEYCGDYISKEITLGYFDLWLSDKDITRDESMQQEYEKKQQALLQLSETLFRKLSTLLS